MLFLEQGRGSYKLSGPHGPGKAASLGGRGRGQGSLLTMSIESPWAGLGVSWMHLSLMPGSLSDTLMSAHALGKGRSCFVALELKLDDRSF